MFIYILILFCSFIFAVYFKHIKQHKVVFNALCVFLICYAGLRYRVGTDSFMYEEMFKYFSTVRVFSISTIFEYNLEPLWVLYMLICKTICNEYLFFQFTIALITNLSVFHFIKHNSNHQFISIFYYILIYFLLVNCEFMRQAFAISIFYLFAFPYLKGKRIVKYYVVCIICCLLHNSLFLSLVFPFVERVKLSFKVIFIASIGMFVFLTFFPIFDLLSMIMPENMNTAAKIMSYSNRESTYNLNYIILKLYEISFMLFIYALTQKHIYKNYIVLFIFVMIVGFSHDIFNRLQYVLFPFYIILLSEATYSIYKYFRNRILSISFIGAFAFLPTFIYYIHTYPGTKIKVYYKFFPYSSYFYPKKSPEREEMAQGEENLLYIFK